VTDPKIVVICGSTRFREAMTVANRMLTLAGHIVLAPGVFAHDGDQIDDKTKAELDALHLRKIDLADWVLVVNNPTGYVGESTAREIAYAESRGKAIVHTAFAHRHHKPACDQSCDKWGRP